MRPLALLLIAAGCGAPVEKTQPDAAALADLAVDGARPITARTTELRVHYPAGARRVTVRGSGGGLDWMAGAATKPGADDTWVFSTTKIEAAIEWKPLLDDKDWSRGPNYRVEPGDTIDVWPHFTTTKGMVTKLLPAFRSAKLKNERVVWAYLPPTYLENARASLPVVYMHDGQNLFDAAMSFAGEWMVDEAIDAAAESGKFREAIVVGIANAGAARIYEYTPTEGGMGGGGADAYLGMIVEELKPVVDKMLRTKPGREDTVVIGSSLGGLVSSYAGVKKGDVFGGIGAMSPSTWWDKKWIVPVVAAAKAARPARVYVDAGDQKDGLDDTKTLVQAYGDAGFSDGKDLKFVVQAGASHSEKFWAERLPGALEFLLGPRE